MTSFDMKCRICGSKKVRPFLDLGNQPHCNRLVPENKLSQDEPLFPLRVGFCENCTLVQIDHTIPKENMFSDYPYVSGTTKTLVRHFQDTTDRLCNQYNVKKGDYVVDIGSNDGSWLSCYEKHGVTVLGVEAASNVAAIASLNGIETINDFFSEGLARKILSERGSAKMITAAGVFFHLEELASVVKGVRALLDDQGIFIVQAIYLGGMIDNVAFDQIYHEHLCYYTLKSLEFLFGLYDLQVIDVSVVPIHGGSLEVHVAPKSKRTVSRSVQLMREAEKAKKLDEFDTYNLFAEKVWSLKNRLISLLETYHNEGKTVFAYGAPAKGATLLNSFGISTNLISAAVEKNPMKIGLYIPGCRIPIIAEGKELPAAYLMLAWNFLDEFLEKEKNYLKNGGEIIVPIPELNIITIGNIP